MPPYKPSRRLSLYAALNTRTGEVMGKTVASHTSEEFAAFLAAVATSRPPQDEIHIIVDNLSANKTKRVGEFLSFHQNVRLHFTRTYSSWLNQVEPWLSKIERDVIARGIFTSTAT
jgi:transposase